MKNVKHESTQASGGGCGGEGNTRNDRETTRVSGGTAAEIFEKFLRVSPVSGKTECHIQTSWSQGLLYSEGAEIFRAAAEPPAGAVPDPSPEGLRNKKK